MDWNEVNGDLTLSSPAFRYKYIHIFLRSKTQHETSIFTETFFELIIFPLSGALATLSHSHAHRIRHNREFAQQLYEPTDGVYAVRAVWLMPYMAGDMLPWFSSEMFIIVTSVKFCRK